MFLGDSGPRLGELDEEFVYERRVGESFVLGNSTWRITAIEAHRVVVSKAEGQSAVMPFWKGESTARSPELGAAVGRSRARSPRVSTIRNCCRGLSANAGSGAGGQTATTVCTGGSSGWRAPSPMIIRY